MSARNLIVGVDFNRSQPQICYYEKEKENANIAWYSYGNLGCANGNSLCYSYLALPLLLYTFREANA